MVRKVPLKRAASCREAVAAYDGGDLNGALVAIRNCRPFYEHSFLYHHTEAFFLYKLAAQSRDLVTVRENLQDAAASAHRAWMLCRNNLLLGHFCASMMYLLSGFNQDYDGVIRVCQEALAIKEPKDPDSELFFIKDSFQNKYVNKMKKELGALIKHCGAKKKWVRVDTKKRYKDCMKEIEERVKEAKNSIKSLSNSPDLVRESVSMENAMANLEKEKDGKSFWSSKMTPKEKENLFKVSIEELKTHLHSLEDNMEIDLVLEAIDFVTTWKRWKFWECVRCFNKFLDWESYTKHLDLNHDWQIPRYVLLFLPTLVNDLSVEIIVKGEWKPVDTDAAIQIMGRRLLFGSKTYEKVSSLSSTDDLEWPLCDDSARTKHLQTVRGMLQSLLRYKCLMQYQIDQVIDLAIQELKDIIPVRLLGTRDLKTLKLVCFLGSSQFEIIFQYLQNLSDAFISNENPEMGSSMDEQHVDGQGFDVKEKVILSEDSSFLLLDGSVVSSANNVHGESTLQASDENLLLYLWQEVGKELESWKSTRGSRKRQAEELLRVFQEERPHLRTRSLKRWENFNKIKAVREVGNFCGVREQGTENSVRIYESRLRKLRKDLLLQFQENNYDAENPSDSDYALSIKIGFISQILEIDQIENSYMFDNRNLSNDSIQEKIKDWSVQLSRELFVDNAVIMRSVDVMKQYSLQLGKVSAYDYQSIMLPVLKSFIQATEGIGQPLLPQDKAEQTVDQNLEIGPSASANEAALEVNMLGTGVTNEALDSFLNMIIQSLWHLREFSEEFMDRSKSQHIHIKNPCVVCALDVLFEGLGEGNAVALASLRHALIVQYQDKRNSREGQMDNASEFLPVILESLHDLLISDLKLQKKASLDCFVVHCYVHRIFGMDHHERINCVKCKVESMHRKYSSLCLSLNADNLRTKKNTHGGKSSDELLKLEMNRQVNCKVCGQENDIYHTLRCLPHVFTIVLVWDKPDESSDCISRTLSALSNDLDLSVLFQRCQPDHKYFLVSLVCGSGSRELYNCFIYNKELEKYVEYNDKNDKIQVIGSWNEVVDTCVKGCRQPIILFFA